MATLPVLALPGLHYVERSLTLDLALGAALTFAALSVAVLAWVRYREGEDPHVLYQAAAFFGLFVGDLIRLAIVIVGHDDALGMSLQRPGQTPIYLWTIQAMVAAVMLLVGGVATLRRWPRDTQPVALVIGAPVALIVLADAIVLSLAPNLPPIATPTSVTELDGVSQVLIPDGPSLALLALQLTIGSLFLGAAILKTAIYERTAGTPTALLAIGLIVAAFAEIHFADAPGGYTSLVTGWDILRALFYAVLLSGVAIGVRNDLRALRAANLELTRLRGLEGRRAALEERARLAREVHDGLVQDLWLARLLQARLGRLPRLNAEDRLLAGQVDAAIESALLEARRVLAIVRHSQSSGAALDDELRRLAIEFSERFGLAADVTVEGQLVPLPETAQAELVSIVREAMTNARKHAAAERVRVNVSGEKGLVRVVVADDGRGFEPQQVEAGFGLQSMRERARAIGAELSLASRPGEGTVVMLLLRPAATSDHDANAYASPLDNGSADT